jgi:putative glutathione S-transferase
MLNDQVAALGSAIPDEKRCNLYPGKKALRDEIDVLNADIYTSINNGAYKAGFSSDQAIYASAFTAYFDTLEQIETSLDYS